MGLPFSAAVLAAINDGAGRALGRRFRVKNIQPVAGGCINRSFMVGDGADRFFVKVNGAVALPIFEAEAAGLSALREAEVRAPMPVAHGLAGSEAYILMECLSLRQARAGDYIGLADALVTLHGKNSSSFGWAQANFIGASRQDNPWAVSWVDFWREARLERQLEMAAQKGYGGSVLSLGERLVAAMARLRSSTRPSISAIARSISP